MAESTFCSSCGAQLPEGAAFCGSCGQKVSNASECNASPCETAPTPAASDSFKNLMYVIWASIGISALSGLIGIFDVREYYSCGRFLYAIICFGPLVLTTWLACAIANRENWARVTFIILGILGVSLLLYGLLEPSDGQNDGNAFVAILDLASLVLDIYCAVMLFTKGIARQFHKSDNGKERACTFWGLLALCFVLCRSGDIDWSFVKPFIKFGVPIVLLAIFALSKKIGKFFGKDSDQGQE